MTSAKVMTSLIAALLAYASIQLRSTDNDVNVAETQDCSTVECATTFALPPSSSLFL